MHVPAAAATGAASSFDPEDPGCNPKFPKLCGSKEGDSQIYKLSHY
jgi:hypothetical protein